MILALPACAWGSLIQLLLPFLTARLVSPLRYLWEKYR